MEATDDRVDGRDDEGTESSESRPLAWGVYWKTGVGSWILEPSRIDSTRLGRGGLWGGSDRPGGGR